MVQYCTVPYCSNVRVIDYPNARLRSIFVNLRNEALLRRGTGPWFPGASGARRDFKADAGFKIGQNHDDRSQRGTGFC